MPIYPQLCGCTGVMGYNKKTDTMRISILLLVFVSLLISCGNLSNNQAQVYATKDGEFIVGIDTLNIDLKLYVNPEKVSLTHAVKFQETYYCFFTDKKESYSKYFFAISNKGTIEKEIKLPRDLTDCFYLDLFVLHDTIFSKPYMNDQSYYLDLKTLNWVETNEPDDVIYEDERYYVTYLDFGEWGSTTWFIDKISGKEYVLSSSSNIINRIDSIYYISGGIRVLKIDNPVNMDQCDKEYYYQLIKKKEYSEGINSLNGTETIFEDTTYSQWDFKEPKIHIITSFKVKNRLFYLCNDSLKTFVAKLENREMTPILSLERKYSTFNWHFSYRCKIQNDNFQLLKFHNETNDTYGFIEFKENKINIRYLNFKNN
jgi:hypothetical protein